MKPDRSRVDPVQVNTTPLKRPEYIQVMKRTASHVDPLTRLMKGRGLHTVCEEAACPNIAECWGHGTATFLILGDICTRSCGFCDIKHGMPLPLDWQEPERVAQAVKVMGLKHAVVTSVNRDERQDGGAPLFAMTIQLIHELVPGCTVEVLIPDFKGSRSALKLVMDAGPEILNHNVETVAGLFGIVQKHDHWEWSQDTLMNAKTMNPKTLTKSGIMVGLGESLTEIHETMRALRDWGVDILTIGQYLQPSRRHLPIRRYYTLQEFDDLKQYGLELGFRWVESAPLVRSSYHAIDQVMALRSE